MPGGGGRASKATATATTIAAAALLCATVAGGIVLYKKHSIKSDKDKNNTEDNKTENVKSRSITAEEYVSKVIANEKDSSSSSINVQSISIKENNDDSSQQPDDCRILKPNTITVTYTSTTGTCKSLAAKIVDEIKSSLSSAGVLLNNDDDNNDGIVVRMRQVAEFDWWDELLNFAEENDNKKDGDGKIPPVVLFILPTWTNGTLPPEGEILLSSLEEISTDWRVAPNHLAPSDVRHSIFGVGSTAYDASTFCKPAKDVHALLTKLGGENLLRGTVAMGDENTGNVEKVFQGWKKGVVKKVSDLVRKSSKNSCGGGKDKKKTTAAAGGDCACMSEDQNTESVGCCQQKEPEEEKTIIEEEEDDDEDDYDDYDDYDDDYIEEEKGEPEVIDLEDIGTAMVQSTKSKKGPPREMVTAKQAAALKKEGYKLIGTHSAVKLCRWTKHQLRGRGGCYKHTFYGITSYQCMEATPSLACANKCVFCWRHHKNPVGKEWRWKTDDPHFIVEEAVNKHVSMIKEAKGIPGVQADRWEEAHTVRHCALSLVGEPIMYPRIDELLADLHSREISTFLVTNGQHPKAIESLRPVTQLYVSVDAPTPESLIEIDRPLFNDAWERLKYSLSCLKDKGQRTVARLTVVKGWNSDDIDGYAKLVALGKCSLVEVKGVTFCGKSDASNLNMTNTPWHHEVVALTQKLQEELAKITAAGGPDAPPLYGLACEHKHSCSVLLARVDQFGGEIDPVTGRRKWKTWIDYPKFHELAARHVEDPTFKFAVEDYVAETPSWALFGAEEEGFDPTDNRHRKKRKHPKYTKFDLSGVPTHDDDGQELSAQERNRLKMLMDEKKKDVGDGSTVYTLKGGEKTVEDASLMFRGLTVTK
mmetsp:Transcript_38430/g.57592  ORF Transcript_38430/g.57592 Transcript_38430/m.57592 type:complete len:872 (-) Transcript_38430:289-2904(-)